jgi:hypothetical protein
MLFKCANTRTHKVSVQKYFKRLVQVSSSPELKLWLAYKLKYLRNCLIIERFSPFGEYSGGE